MTSIQTTGLSAKEIATLTQALTFTGGKLPKGTLDLVHVMVLPGTGCRMQGWAYSPGAYPGTLPNGRAYLVLIEVPDLCTYPYKVQHYNAVPAVTWESWEDELVHVLAHELRHVVQFTQRNGLRYYEVDAERYAIEIVTAYRAAA